MACYKRQNQQIQNLKRISYQLIKMIYENYDDFISKLFIKIINIMSKKGIKQEPDQSTLKLWLGYKKRCDFYGIAINSSLKVKLQECIQRNKFQLLHLSEQIGPMQIRSIMQVSSQQKYQKLKKIRILKGNIGDQGVRFICKFLTTTYSLELIDLLDNNITHLGCQFLGKSLASSNNKILQLKLDDNNIGSQGLKNLTLGLRQNNILDKLSLKYCGIDASGAKYIQEILANLESKLRSLKLQGNQFGNEGIYLIIRAVQCSQSLQKINIADTKMNLLEYTQGKETIVQNIGLVLQNIMRKNQKIKKYDIRFNPMHDAIADSLLRAIQFNLTIKKMEFSNNVAYKLRDQLDTILRKRNKFGKGKGKGKSPSKKGSKK